MRSRTRIAAAIAIAIAGIGAGAINPPPASAQPDWAPVDTATIHPGVQTFTEGGQCTANFVFYDSTDVYIGQAAHCAGTGGSTATDGCTSGSLPTGTPVTVGGATRPGTLVYSSWLTMQQHGETDPEMCQFNDFALVRLHPDDTANVNPSIPYWGGPVGVSEGGTAVGDQVFSYGNSSLRFGLTVLSPKTGLSLGTTGDGWSHNVYTATPGIPGDSGSAFLDADGNALGVLATLQVLPVVGSNGVGDVSRELAYANASTTLDVELALGTEPFSPSLLPIGGLPLGLG